MKLYIPALGDALRLTAPWNFQFCNEQRNKTIYTHFFPNENWNCWSGSRMATIRSVMLPAGTELIVDRIYIRAGGSDFDSVTFSIPKNSVLKNPNRIRFWVKLKYANNIEFEAV